MYILELLISNLGRLTATTMYTLKRFALMDMARWTRRETSIFFLIALLPTVLHNLLGYTWIHLPWLPIALIGTAVAFIISFRNNVTYNRIWEARKIWGGMVNASRTWGLMIKDTVTNEYTKEPVTDEELKAYRSTLIHRHIAWLTAMRHAMRQGRTWEVFLQDRTNREWAEMMHIPERETTLEDDLKGLLSEEERQYVLQKTNRSTAVLSLQSTHLRELKERKIVWEFSFLELENILKDLFDCQGRSERIKNFPYPRQYATLNHYFVWIFILMLPFGVIPEFAKIGVTLVTDFPIIGSLFIWLAIPFVVIVSWVFHTMERIGRVGENPFEGSANDVPISTIARGIEIDLREMIDEEKDKIPDPVPVVYGVQM